MATVTNQTEFKAAIEANDPEIIVANNISLTSSTTIEYSVNIKGEPGVSIFWFPPSISDRFMFVVTAAGNLTMDTLTLDAQGRNGGMVKLEGGTFIMNDGVIIQNIVSTTDSNAVRLETLGGTFIMNGGLITGLDMGMSTAVLCRGGTVTMNGSAAIDNNDGMAVNIISTSDSIRPKFTMTGESRISNNRSGQAGAIISMRADIVIGVNQGDAPRITGNSSPGNGGGIYAGYASNVSIGQNAEISENSCARHHGAILVQNDGSTLHISGNAKIINNRSGVHSGAISIIANAQAVIEGDVEISGNIAGDTTIGAGGGYGGGILLGTGGSLELKGNVIIHDNTADNGGGIYLATPPNPEAYAAPVLIIGADGSSPSIYNNTARNLGGGLFIGDTCDVTLTGQASVYDNKAPQGQGVYNDGILKVAASPKILDGLFFDCIPMDYSVSSLAQSTDKLLIELYDPEYSVIEFDIMLHDIASINVKKTGAILSVHSAAGLQLVQCDKAPIIDGVLTAEAEIHIESSGYITLPNVPLVIAVGDNDTIPLTENDRAAWRIPLELDPGYAIMLTSDADKVIIDAINYDIVYNDLYGATNTNPASYKINGLPIKFVPPGERKGYAFMRWRDAAGNFVTEIPAGSTGNLALTAVWQAQVYNILYQDLFGAAHPNPASYSVENLPIVFAPPGERSGYAFMGWRDVTGNFATEIPAGSTGDLAFTAVWQAQIYNIVYYNLFGATHPNPAFYSIENLPIQLAAPSKRPRYAFMGWRDAAGNFVTQIPAGSTGNLALTAVWQAQVYNIVYYNLFGATHTNPTSYSIDNLPIWLAAPSGRPGYIFMGWRDAAGNILAQIPAGSTGNLALTAVWQAQIYNIVYYNLFGATHINPTSYSIDNLPIRLAAPSERPGYIFMGWRDAAGNFLTQIPAGSTGNLALTAIWAELVLSFDGNAPCVCNVPKPIRAENGVARIPYTRPCRSGYVFACWNESAFGNGKSYCPGGKMNISGNTATLYAQWLYVGCCCR